MSITKRIVDGAEVTTYTGQDLQDLKNNLALKIFGDTPEGACVRCKKPFTCENVRTEAERRESQLSRLCGICWDAMCAEGQ